jgi:membrane-bound ClpP family serine protease
VSLPAAAAAGAALGAFTVFGLAKALRVRHAPARGGAGDLIGAVGVVCTPLTPEGLVLVSGERWRARTAGARYARVGERVRVEAVAGLTLHVRHAEALTDQEES